jgi:hypothetical protein
VVILARPRIMGRLGVAVGDRVVPIRAGWYFVEI